MARYSDLKLLILLSVVPATAWADPSLECSIGNGSQIEIGNCVAAAETSVDQALDLALQFAMDSAKELDGITEREMAAPALEAGQVAWSAFRDAHCEFIGTTFGGGSGTGIAIQSCRVELGRARIAQLMAQVR